MSVQARFFVQQITRSAGHDSVQVKLAASSRGPENKSWAKYTPAGTLELSISNPSASKWFEERLGKDVALTFEDRPYVCPSCQAELPITGEYHQYASCPECKEPIEFN